MGDSVSNQDDHTPVGNDDVAVGNGAEERSLPCSFEIFRICPEGKTDACGLNDRDPRGHICVDDNNNGLSEDCSREIMILCGDGQVDECRLNPSGSHRCVADTRPVLESAELETTESFSTIPCSFEIIALCPGNQVDACVLNPNHPSGHVCVQRPSAGGISDTCSREIFLMCPMGLIDSCELNPSTNHRRCVPRVPGRCYVNGRTYSPGQDVPDADECNECICQSDSTLACTERACLEE